MLTPHANSQKSLRIVLVMLEPPLPFGNAAGRWFYVLLKGLVERGHRVTALAACSDQKDIAASEELFPAPKYDLRLFPFPKRGRLADKWNTFWRPYSYMFSAEFSEQLKRCLNDDYDILHMEQLWCSWQAPIRSDRTLINIHYLFSIDLSEVPKQGWQQHLNHQLMLRGERHLLKNNANFLALSDRIADAVRVQNPQANVDVVPLGMELKNYEFIQDQDRTTAPVISVIGSMGWYPSRSAAERLLRKLWPQIKQEVPNAKIQIVGWNARQALSEFIGMQDVEIHENVPDILPYFRNTAVLLYAPGKGSGMKVKVLESFAMGVPVVTTSEGVEGIPAQDGIHAGIAEDDASIICRTVQLLNSVEEQNRQRHAARKLMEEHCSSARTLDRLEFVYNRRIQSLH